MTTKAEITALTLLKQKHRLKWHAPLGKRTCNYEISKACLETGSELDKKGILQWKGRMCKPCLKVKMQQLHKKRIEDQGGYKKRGRPVGSKNKITTE